MRQSEGGVALFALGTNGELQRFKTVEFLGGDRGDMPSQGDFSREADRDAIASLEVEMATRFGHHAIRTAAEGMPETVDLGAQMLMDEHMVTLQEAVDAGMLAKTTSVSLNSNPNLTEVPPLNSAGLPLLQKLTCINCHNLKRLPDLSRFPKLNMIKLEECHQLEAIPALPAAFDTEALLDCHLPPHLATGPG